MPLSINKLEKLLSTKGFIPNKYFIIDKCVVYIEVISIETADTFLLYIPSKYNFQAIESKNVYNISYIDINNYDDNTADNYAGALDEYELENKYNDIDMGISPTLRGNNIEKNLEENYKRDINLKDISESQNQQIKNIYRQLKRLRFCVQNVKYKISIIYKNFICSIKRDDSIEIYAIKKFKGQNCHKIYITIDLELLYEKIDSVIINIKTIQKGLYHILDKNNFKNTGTLQQLLENKLNIINFSTLLHTKIKTYETYIKDTEDMLDAVNESEKSTLMKINEYTKNNINGGLSEDIQKTHTLSLYNSELKDIKKIKEDIIKTILELKTKRGDIMLKVDKIMFDNNVMVECVIRNFSDLSKMCNE